MHIAPRTIVSFVFALGMALVMGCGGTLPEPVYANQVDEYFPEPAADAPDAEATRAVRLEAETCAARLNGHRSSAETVSLIQAILSTFTGVTSGVGGVLSAVDLGNPDITTAMGAMSAAGAAVGLAGNLIIGFLANPLEEQRLHAQGLRSFELAVELRYGGADAETVRQSLTRCTHDEAPPIRTTGSGPAFSL